MDGEAATPRLLWDCGTAYDLFISLAVLHEPDEFGLRPKWAAGVRARIPPAEREILEETQNIFLSPPFHWVHALPEPKDGATALWVLRQTPPAARLPALTLSPRAPAEAQDLLRDVASRGAGSREAAEVSRALNRCQGAKAPLPEKRLKAMLEWWTRAEEFGERLLAALQSYQEAFFAEEERRIASALQAALARAQDLAARLELPDLIEELTQGLRFSELPQVSEFVLAPSYWSTPIAFYGDLSLDREIWLFGARPADASLVPGEAVPDALLRALKALSDPTRLRILRLLSAEPLIPAELARRLRLRAQTVSHHLRVLRLAGLVQVTLGEDEEKYGEPHAARSEAVATAYAALQDFLAAGEGD
jgi:DNA-binding transcriptional ArsR family regulator